MPSMTATDWLQIVRGEYLEIPGLALTRAQIQRMWCLDGTTCDAMLDALTRMRFLRLTRDNRYIRGGNGEAAPRRADTEWSQGGDRNASAA